MYVIYIDNIHIPRVCGTHVAQGLWEHVTTPTSQHSQLRFFFGGNQPLSFVPSRGRFAMAEVNSPNFLGQIRQQLWIIFSWRLDYHLVDLWHPLVGYTIRGNIIAVENHRVNKWVIHKRTTFHSKLLLYQRVPVHTWLASLLPATCCGFCPRF
jgi:hypothetical protein